MHASKKYFYDKLILLLLSLLAFFALLIAASILLRVGSGQGISEYYVEYRQGPSHSLRGDFSPTGDVWSILNFIWFSVITLAVCFTISFKTYAIKRDISVVVLALGVLLLLLAFIVSNVLLSHR